MKRRRETRKDLQRQILQRRRETLGTSYVDDETCQRTAEGWSEMEQAHRRSDRGLYGVCIDCERAMPLARLKDKPEAIRCVRCQSTCEHRHTVHGSLLKRMCA